MINAGFFLPRRPQAAPKPPLVISDEPPIDYTGGSRWGHAFDCRQAEPGGPMKGHLFSARRVSPGTRVKWQAAHGWVIGVVLEEDFGHPMDPGDLYFVTIRVIEREAEHP